MRKMKFEHLLTYSVAEDMDYQIMLNRTIISTVSRKVRMSKTDTPILSAIFSSLTIEERIGRIFERGFELAETEEQHDFFVKLTGVISAYFPEVDTDKLWIKYYKIPLSYRT